MLLLHGFSASVMFVNAFLTSKGSQILETVFLRPLWKHQSGQQIMASLSLLSPENSLRWPRLTTSKEESVPGFDWMQSVSSILRWEMCPKICTVLSGNVGLDSMQFILQKRPIGSPGLSGLSSLCGWTNGKFPKSWRKGKCLCSNVLGTSFPTWSMGPGRASHHPGSPSPAFLTFSGPLHVLSRLSSCSSPAHFWRMGRSEVRADEILSPADYWVPILWFITKILRYRAHLVIYRKHLQLTQPTLQLLLLSQGW